MPAASFFSSASSFFSCSSRDARADCTRCWLVCTLRAALRTCVATCICEVLELRLRLLVLQPRAREVRLRDVLVPSG